MPDLTVTTSVDNFLASSDQAAMRTNLALGTAATTASTDYATAAQGATADSAQQPPTEGAFVDGDKTKLDGIAAGAEVNTIESDVTGEPTGSDQVLNVVSLTQAEYDAGTPVATTLYVIV
jgi:predicted RecA/RadA family phage recombinase